MDMAARGPQISNSRNCRYSFMPTVDLLSARTSGTCLTLEKSYLEGS
jgi:hypothetical protein